MTSFSSGIIALLLGTALVIADAPATEKAPFALAKIDTEKLAEGAEIINGTNGLIIYKLIPNAAEQGWTVAVDDLTMTVPAHYHDIQTQVLIVLEGKLKQTIDGHETIYSAGQHVVVPTGVVHSQEPVDGLCRIMEVDLQGKAFPEDVYFTDQAVEVISSDVKEDVPGEIIVDRTISETIESLRTIPSFDLTYAARSRIGEKYALYDLVPAGTIESNPWSMTLLEIHETPMHYHLIGKEIFVIVNGEAEVTIADETYHLIPGQVIHIPPTMKHKIKSASEDPVRILFVNFPAYDRQDTHILD